MEISEDVLKNDKKLVTTKRGYCDQFLTKNRSQVPIFLVTIFLSNLSMSSEFSTGHAFHLFKLIFSVVTSFVLLSEEYI